MSTLYSFQNNMRMIERKTFIIGTQKNDVKVTFHTKCHATYLWQPFTIVLNFYTFAIMVNAFLEVKLMQLYHYDGV